MKFYLRMEGVNLANFVYDTQDLSTVRGGGLLLLGAVEQVLQQVTSVKLDPINTGASSGLFQFDATDDEAAESVCQAVESFLKGHSQLRHATFVVDVQRAGTNFVHDREALLARNRWRQMSQPTVAIPEWNAQKGVGVCDIDQVRPATRLMHGPEQTERVSASVQTRREFGREQKQRFYKEQTGMAANWDFAHDLDELTHDLSRGNLHHKMAVVYLDGNGFGKLQNELCTTPETQHQFDRTVKDYRQKILTALLESMHREKEHWTSSQNRYRLETLLWGGDEIIWVVPAWQGWKTLALFYQQSKNWTFAGHKLTHAAGMVFCHHNAPIHRITTLAKDLAELAKEKNREKNRQENCFAYLVLESFDHIGRDLKQFVKDRYGDFKELILPGDGMDSVQAAFAKLKLEESLPRRKLYQIVQQLRKDQTQAERIIGEITGDSNVELEALRNYFGTNDAGWFHIAELWDYIGS